MLLKVSKIGPLKAEGCPTKIPLTVRLVPLCVLALVASLVVLAWYIVNLAPLGGLSRRLCPLLGRPPSNEDVHGVEWVEYGCAWV